MDNSRKIWEATRTLGRNQRLIVKSLYLSPLPIERFSSVKSTVVNLQDRGLVELKNGLVSLTEMGQAVYELWQKTNDEKGEILIEDIPKLEKVKQENPEKSNQFLKLYKQGLNGQKIGNIYGVSRERVRQVLHSNPAFHEYLKEREKEQEKAKAMAEWEKKELAKQQFYSKSLAALYPEKVPELWDYEKNGDLKPEDVAAGTNQQYIWFKCPIDGYSWKKKPNDITTSWTRSGTSGCPMCAGKKKKAEKQPALTTVYPELIKQYWNYEKNSEFNLDPEKLTLASNKKSWFKCPHDGNEWQTSIALIIGQQWSKGNAGCRVCNGTNERKRGEWQRRDSIAIEFPNEVTKYWLYETNNELGLDPSKLTAGSAKEAFFKCPIDGHEWVAPLSQIKGSWQRGNSGCPVCRGFDSVETTSLVSIYPDYVAQYWDHEKNDRLKIFPGKVTRGSGKEVWFKCPHDGYEWKNRIGSISNGAWKLGNSGCSRCSGWNLEGIRQFVASLETHIPNLTQAELYKIFEQSGVLNTQSEGIKIAKDIIRVLPDLPW